MEKIPYYSLNEYLQDTFGCKVYKVSLDAGFTCPNRDGKLGTRGCIFCSKGGSGDFASDRKLSIKAQLKEGKELVAKKLPKTQRVKYIAYFQAFTNTYAPVEVLRDKYMEAVNDEDVCCISIATRPDCLSEEVLELLSKINRIKPVWVELGLQTIHEETASYIRRGYSLEVYDKAVRDLKDRKIEVITHVIIGLPGESLPMMKETVKYLADSGVKGIKLQLLHVLKDTDLCKDYEMGKFKTLELEEYVEILKELVLLIPKDMVIHRLTGDGDKKTLVAPLWSADKKRVLNTINKVICPGGEMQGCNLQ